MACKLHQDNRASTVIVYTVAELYTVKVCAEGDVLFGFIGAFDVQDNISGWTGNIFLNQGEGYSFRLSFYQFHCIDCTQNTAWDLAVTQSPAAQFSFWQIGLFANIGNVAVPGQECCYTVANHSFVNFFVHLAVVDKDDHAFFIIQVNVSSLLNICKWSGQTFCRCAAGTTIALNFPLFSCCCQGNLLDVCGLNREFLDYSFQTNLCKLIADDFGCFGFFWRSAGTNKVDFLQILKDSFSHCFCVLQNVHVATLLVYLNS